jgi:hypothetical protein
MPVPSTRAWTSPKRRPDSSSPLVGELPVYPGIVCSRSRDFFVLIFSGFIRLFPSWKLLYEAQRTGFLSVSEEYRRYIIFTPALLLD